MRLAAIRSVMPPLCGPRSPSFAKVARLLSCVSCLEPAGSVRDEDRCYRVRFSSGDGAAPPDPQTADSLLAAGGLLWLQVCRPVLVRAHRS